MKELVKIERNDKYGLVVSSRVIANNLEKRHMHVLRDLDGILRTKGVYPDLDNPLTDLIIPSFYTHAQNKQQYREYLLTKDGFILYMFNIQGYIDFKMAYINKFNQMEKELRQMKLTEVRPALSTALIPLNKTKHWERLKDMQKGIHESGMKLFKEMKKVDESIQKLHNIKKEILGYMQMMNYDIHELEN